MITAKKSAAITITMDKDTAQKLLAVLGGCVSWESVPEMEGIYEAISELVKYKYCDFEYSAEEGLMKLVR